MFEITWTFIEEIHWADPSKARGSSTKMVILHILIHSIIYPLPPMALWCCHAHTVRDGASSHKIDNFTQPFNFQNLKGYQSCIIGSKGHLCFKQAQSKTWAWPTWMKAKTKLALQSWKPTFLFMEPYLDAILFKEKTLNYTLTIALFTLKTNEFTLVIPIPYYNEYFATQIVYYQVSPAANNCMLQTLGSRVFPWFFCLLLMLPRLNNSCNSYKKKKKFLQTIFLDIEQNSIMEFSIITVILSLWLVDENEFLKTQSTLIRIIHSMTSYVSL